jgi:hypothetical protein
MKQKSRHYSTGKYYKKLHKFLLGLFSLTHFLFYPALMVTCLFYNWKFGLMVFGARFLFQTVAYVRTLNKLDEKDLIPYILLFDIWMFFYYLIFAPALIRKARMTWK